MKIAIWWEQVLWGGVDTHLLTLVKNWPNKHDEIFIFYNRSNQGVERIRIELKKIHYIKLVELEKDYYYSRYISDKFARIGRFVLLPFNLAIMKLRYIKILKEYGKFDVLLSDNGGYPGAWGSLSAIWAGCYINIPVRILLIHHSAGPRRPFRQNFEKIIDHFIQIWATDIVTVSYATRDTLIVKRDFDIEKMPIRVIYNGIEDCNLRKNNEIKFNLRESYGISRDEIIVGMMGRVERYKGHEDLIIALGILKDLDITNVTVVIIGQGEVQEIDELKLLAKKNNIDNKLVFCGYLNEKSDVLISQFDILAMLTKDFEGFGLTIAEAMIVKTPVIATSVGAVPEFVSNRTACLINPESPESIASAIIKIINKKQDVDEMTREAYKVIAKFRGDSMSRNFLQLICNSRGFK